MKAFLKFLLPGILGFVSCARISPDYIDSQADRQFLVVEAGFDDARNKTVIDPDDPASILWQPHDAFTMFCQGDSAKFSNDISAPAKFAQFSGCIRIATGAYDSPVSNEFFGIYPHRKTNDFINDGTFVFDIDSLQTAVPNSFDPLAFPAIAHSQNLGLAFYNVCGGVAFTLKNEGIRTIVFSSKGNKHIAGRVEAHFNSDGVPEITGFREPADSIVLKAPGNGTFATGVKYYISMAPSVLNEGFSVTFIKKALKGTYSRTESVAVKRSVFGLIENIDKDIEFTLNVEKVVLDSHHLVVELPEAVRLNATVLPEDASDHTIIWRSGDENVATVDETGLVTPLQAGKVSILATSRANPEAKDSCLVEFINVTDLSEGGTANCYLVTEPGRYKFRSNARGASGAHLGNVTSAERLWQFKGVEYNMYRNPVVIIDSVMLSDDKEWVKFSVPEQITDGSAIVAVRDNGTVLWSWHIWVAEGYDPEETAQEYGNGAGIVMDRNLGSCSATAPNYQNPGMYYQWGRKDPFPGFYGFAIGYVTGWGPAWPGTVVSSASTGTIAYTVAHPMTYLTTTGENYNYDWYYVDDIGIVPDTSRWGETKTDYDPCPYGWKVPKGGPDGLWAVAAATSETITIKDRWLDSEKGMYLEDVFGVEDGKCWYGATGSFLSSDGDINVPRTVSFCWSSTYDKSQNRAFCMHLNKSDEIYPVYWGKGAAAMTVRCVRDAEE